MHYHGAGTEEVYTWILICTASFPGWLVEEGNGSLTKDTGVPCLISLCHCLPCVSSCIISFTSLYYDHVLRLLRVLAGQSWGGRWKPDEEGLLMLIAFSQIRLTLAFVYPWLNNFLYVFCAFTT